MKLKRALLALAAFAVSSLASATIVVIDDFNSPNVGPLSVVALNAPTVFSDAVRSGTFTMLVGPPNGSGATMTIGSGSWPVGLLAVGNDAGRDTEVTLAWNIAAGLLPANATNIGFFMQVVESDGNLISLEFLLNNSLLAMFNIASNTVNQGVNFGLSTSQITSLSGGGTLGLKINGERSWDLALDTFGFQYDLPAGIRELSASQVPEPGSLALVALALAAAGIARRRKV